jgi:hypothetical protein
MFKKKRYPKTSYMGMTKREQTICDIITAHIAYNFPDTLGRGHKQLNQWESVNSIEKLFCHHQAGTSCRRIAAIAWPRSHRHQAIPLRRRIHTARPVPPGRRASAGHPPAGAIAIQFDQ